MSRSASTRRRATTSTCGNSRSALRAAMLSGGGKLPRSTRVRALGTRRGRAQDSGENGNRSRPCAALYGGGRVIKKSRFVLALGLTMALGVGGMAFGDGASDNEAFVDGKLQKTKMDKKQFKPNQLFSGVRTETN